VPLKRWPERRWRPVEGVVGVAERDAAVREEVREQIRQVLARYAANPALTDEVFVDHTDPEPLTAERERDTALDLATLAELAVKHGVQLVVPPGKDGRLVAAFVRHSLRILNPSRRPLGPKQLRVLAVRWRRYAARRRDRPGRPVNIAEAELVGRLAAIIERHCGRGTAVCRWKENPSDDVPGAGWYVGRLYELVRLLQPAMPRIPGSMAECSPVALGMRIRRALRHWKRLLPAPAR
jgi:hypothetical protein